MILFDFLLIFIINFTEKQKSIIKNNNKKMKTKQLSKKVLSLIMLGMWTITIMIETTGSTKANNVHLYLDSATNSSSYHYCKNTVDTVIIHKKTGTTIQSWNISLPPYDFYGDTLCIANTYNTLSPSGLVGCYYSGEYIGVNILFDSIVTSPNIMDQTICGQVPITLDAGNGNAYAKYFWSTGDTTQVFTINTNVYWVQVSSACNIITDSFNIVFVHVDGEGCAATFDQTTQKNKIIWDGTNLQGDKQIILKRALNNVLTPVDTVAFNSGEWIDLNSNPQSEESGYAVQPIDTCHNMGNVSTEMVTIWLSISEYQGDTYFTYTLGAPEQPTYQLNGIKATGEVDSLASRPASFNNILLPSAIAEQYIKFYISYAIHCGDSKGTIQVKSNTVSGITGIPELQNNTLSVYPNPVYDILTLHTDNIEQLDIQLVDIVGNILYRGNQTTIDMTTHSSGMYILKIFTSKGVNSSKIIKR